MSKLDFIPQEIALSQLEAWSDILPRPHRILAANLFLDVFLLDADGAVFMLEISAGSVTRIAASEEEFSRRCIDDEDGWLLRPLVEQCLDAGMVLGKTQCYAFTTLPFLGGEYHTDNIWMCQWAAWLSFTAHMYSETKHLPDGAVVKVTVVE